MKAFNKVFKNADIEKNISRERIKSNNACKMKGTHVIRMIEKRLTLLINYKEVD